MKNKNKRKILIAGIIVSSIIIIVSGGYLYLVNQLKSTLTGGEPVADEFYETIDFEYIGGWIVVRAKIAGSDKDYPFIFDTGSTTIISDSLVKELKSESFKTFFSGKDDDTTNAFNNQLLVLNRLSIGDVSFRNVGSMVLDNENWDMLNCVSAFGIIGCNIIKSGCFQIDYVKRKIIITEKSDNLANSDEITWVKYKTDGQETPIITGKLNGTDIDLFFDTGSSSGITLYSPVIYNTIKSDSTVKKIYLTLLPSLYIRGEEAEPYQAITFKASELHFLSPDYSENIRVTVTDTPEKKFSGIAGNKYLENYNITLDYKNKRIGYVMTGRLSSTEAPYFGFNYFVLDNKLFINSITDKSEISKSQIVVGDEIISINGTEIIDLPKESFCAIFRNEYYFYNETDSLMHLSVKHDDRIISLALNKCNSEL